MTANAPIDTYARFLHRAMTCPRIQKRLCKMPDRAPILVVFGEGRDRVSCLTERATDPALNSSGAAGLMCGMDRGRGGSHRPRSAPAAEHFRPRQRQLRCRSDARAARDRGV